MDKVEEEAKSVGGIGNVILGGQSQGAQTVLGTAIHLKDRYKNESLGGIVDMIGPVPISPNGEQHKLHKTPILVYLAGADDFYDVDTLKFGYKFDHINETGANFEFHVQPNVGHGTTDKMLAKMKQFLYKIIPGKHQGEIEDSENVE